MATYSNPNVQLIPCTINKIKGCQATNHLIQSNN